ncbi:MAG: hemerythrin domain-containing protein [Candidatus Polarisedimenticolaceae bacterium]|nr:hemerythrin domain-containing protein [Candidatus Polarisedimenticolaceae bacterium]
MPKLTDAMTSDHKRCDEIFVQAEEAVSEGDWERAAALFKEFEEAIEQHFLMEETVLFPAYSAKTNLSSVTDALMNEHMQMRIMIFEAGESIKTKDQEQFLGQAETLLTILQQHNRKEESKMYTMADSSLRGDVDELLSKMGMV